MELQARRSFKETASLQPFLERSNGAMRVLVAFDKFKDSLTASRACEVTGAIFRNHFPDCLLEIASLTDGGEGFCEILTTAAKGRFETIGVRGPRGEPCTARLGLVQAEDLSGDVREVASLPPRGVIAVFEMAAAAGLSLLVQKDRDPWETSTHGVGDMITRCIEKRVDVILLGIGGSATNDLGFGALQALGLRFLDKDGRILERVRPSSWSKLIRMDGEIPDLPPIRIACDVDNPLLGQSGATKVYGPQKGVLPRDLERMEEELSVVAHVLIDATGENPSALNESGAGAAGGLGFGLRAAAGASFVPGFPLVSAWLGLQEHIENADLIVTGEGRFDESSLRGKGPGLIVKMASKAAKPVLVLAGSVDSRAAAEIQGFYPKTVIREISNPKLSLEDNMREASENLAKVLQDLIENENWNLS